MAFALVRVTADGNNTPITLGYSYRNESDIVVQVDGVTKTLTTHYTFPTTNTITFTTGNIPTSGQIVVVRRATSHSTRLVDYVAGATLTESDLDTDSIHAFNMAQEAIDFAQDSIAKNAQDLFDGQNKRIINVADPTNAQDVSTKAFVEAQLSNNSSQATAAAASQAAAATSETNSANSATASANSATASANSATQSANEVIAVAPKFTFSTNTAMSDGGVGIVRFNNSNASSTTSIIVDDQTADTGNPNIEDTLKTFDDSTSTIKGVLKFVEVGTPQNFATYHVTGLTDSSGFIEYAVTHVDSNFDSGTTFGDTDSLRMTFYRTGDLGTQGIQGIQGNVGNTGPAGAAATVAVGSTTTGAAGSSASVANSGSSSAATLDFTIPRGATGATGTAATVAIGTVTTGSPGSSATVTNSGSATAATFDFSIPQGATGAAGSGSGDVSGPASSVDNALVRMDGTTGKTIQSSNVTLSDAGVISATGLTLTNDLTVGNGGTGASSFTAHGVLIGNTSSAINVTAVGTSGQVLTSNGSGSDPTFQDAAASGGPGVSSSGTAEFIRENAATISGNVSITAARNAFSAGPITISGSATVTIPANSTYRII